MTRLDHHDPAIDEPDTPLIRAGVGGLDYPLERPVGRQHQAPVRAGVSGPHARDEDCGRGAAPLRQQMRQRLGRKQRGVPVENEDLVDIALQCQRFAECVKANAHSVAGSERRVLDDTLRRSN